MRITTGIYRGRLIKMPESIRPTQDKVRKAFFDILGDIEGLSFLELFAGSGAVGIEAISRGVKELTLVENNRECLTVIKENMQTLNITGFNLLPLGVEKVIPRFYTDKRAFDVIFLDPPYIKAQATPNAIGEVGVPPSAATPNAIGEVGVPPSAAKKTLQMLGAYDILAPYGLVGVQHFKKDKLPERCENLSLIKESAYADTLLSFYNKKKD